MFHQERWALGDFFNPDPDAAVAARKSYSKWGGFLDGFADFDPRFLQVAPPGLVAPGYLQAGDWIQVQGATPSGLLRFQLPPARIEVTFVLDGAPQLVPANLDTVLIEPDQDRVVLVWRAAMRCDKKALRVNEIQVAALKAA